MAEENTTQTTEKQPETPTKIKCPCCGEMTINRPPDIKSAVLDEYMASIITGVPFQHTYTIYSTVDITVSILSKQQGRLLYAAQQMLERLIKTDVIKDKQLVAALSELYGTVSLYSAIPSIKTYKEKRMQKEFLPANAALAACEKLVHNQTDVEKYYKPELDASLKHVPDMLMDIYKECCQEEKLSSLPDIMLQTIVRTHNDIYNILMQTGFDENFWKGIELA